MINKLSDSRGDENSSEGKRAFGVIVVVVILAHSLLLLLLLHSDTCPESFALRLVSTFDIPRFA
jgi:hypothetical protein